MHTLKHGDHRMHFNSDMSGEVIFHRQGGEETRVPGELIRAYVEEYVIGKLRDELDDLHETMRRAYASRPPRTADAPAAPRDFLPHRGPQRYDDD